ncbi:MAG: ATP-binding protein, partial [Candidatus Nanohaloarchaeota archaeon QJJ-5]|nr:ATP-binding protein [Candidatus Nanohaloarchaeota archaeon QJJ-5]
MTWLRSDTETLYDDDLSRFVAAALRDDTVDEIVDAATNHEPIELNDRNTAAEPYVEKMLDEEVQKQFGDPKRSLVDLALNSVDARPDDAENYTVRLYNTPWSFTVADEGNGMGIETIVEQLLVPFSSEKDPTEDIGRFGVGFYSSLEHVMANPEQSTVAVNTHDGEDSYRLAFSTDGQQIDDLQLQIEEGTRKRQGTTVSVKHPNADRSEIGDYVRDYLGAMNPERVTFKGLFRQINTLPDGDRHHGTFQYDGDTHEILAVTDPESTAMDLTVTSQGVTIMDDDFSYGNVMINLPPAVGLVEGRNDFKHDAVYEKAVQTAYETLAEGIDAETYDRFVQELFPTLEDTFDIEVDRAVKETVKDTMDRGTYLVPYRDGLASNMV